MARDLYQILSVSKSASSDEIRKAYRQLARENHPDLNPDDASAEERFKETAVAYEVLSDKKKRNSYDEFGEESLKSGFDPDLARQYGQWGGGGRSWPGSSGPGPRRGNPFATGGGVDLSDLFGDLFGSSMGGMGRAQRLRGNDISSNVVVSLLEALRGTSVTLSLKGRTTCTKCEGLGHLEGAASSCAVCRGTGKKSIGSAAMAMSAPCTACGGTGRAPGPRCSTCGGRGHVADASTVTVKIPPGVAEGDKIRLTGKGEPGLGGGTPGDLYLEVKVKPHPLLEREGDDLKMTVPITVSEAVMGATVEVPTVDGEVRVKVPPGSQSGAKLRLRGKGGTKKKGGGAGDLILTLDLRLPEQSDKKVEAAAKSFDTLYDGDVRASLVLD